MYPSVLSFLNLSIHGNQISAERLLFVFFFLGITRQNYVNDEKSLGSALLWEFNFGILFLVFGTLRISATRTEREEKCVLECTFGARIQLQHQI